MRALSFDGASAGPGRGSGAGRRAPYLTHLGTSLAVELRSPAEMEDVLEPWRALAARALEPALSAEPDLLLPALQHLAGGRQASLMLVWRVSGTARVLRGVLPLASRRLGLGSREVLLWGPGPGWLGAPLIDREDPEATIEAALRGLCARGGCAGLTLPLLAEEGPIARRLAEVAARSGRRLDRFACDRTVWIAPPEGPDSDEPARSGARPSAGPRLELEQARAGREIRDAVETFLVLDSMAANAARRASLVQDPGVATFVRTATRQFARSRRCRVDTLRSAGAPAASAITFETGDAVWLWASAVLPEAEAHRPALLRPIAARARRRRKTLYILDESLIGEASPPELGLRRTALADHFVSTRPGASAAVHWRRHLERKVQELAHEGLRRLHRLTGRSSAA